MPNPSASNGNAPNGDARNGAAETASRGGPVSVLESGQTTMNKEMDAKQTGTKRKRDHGDLIQRCTKSARKVEERTRSVRNIVGTASDVLDVLKFLAFQEPNILLASLTMKAAWKGAMVLRKSAEGALQGMAFANEFLASYDKVLWNFEKANSMVKNMFLQVKNANKGYAAILALRYAQFLASVAAGTVRQHYHKRGPGETVPAVVFFDILSV